jgi:hypothetical protein
MFNITKPSKISGLKKTPRCRPFYVLVFSVILVFGLFNGFLVKNALADNNYIDQILFFNDTANGNHATLQFHVKTSFDIYVNDAFSQDFCTNMGAILLDGSPNVALDYYTLYNLSTNEYVLSGQTCNTQTLFAGNTYKMALSSRHFISNWVIYYVFDNEFYNSLSSDNYVSNIFCNYATQGVCDTGTYYLTVFPTLTITFPHDNDTIAGAFDIQGSFIQPAGNNADHLQVDYEPAGTFSNSLTFWTFNINNATSGTFDIPINGIPAGYYDFNVYFRGGDNDFYLGGTIHNLHIVNDIPPVLPNTTSTPPIIPAFPTANPIDYHAQFCEYGTSTTPLFNTLTGAVGGVITSIGQSLADFAGKFSLTDAKNTGQMLADSVLTMREYVASLNAFFGDLPVGQILVLYLITFVLVILFRVIKSLVNLIKP